MISVTKYFEVERQIRNLAVSNHPTLQAPHIERTRQSILEGAKGLSGHLILLAPDATERDIMPKLAAQFSKITLIGLCEKSLRNCFDVVPKNLQEKTEIVVC